MRFDKREFILKDGRRCVLRPAVPEDAEALIEYMKKTAGETPYLLRYPDEVQYTAEAERELLQRFLDDPGTVMLTAEVDGQLAGNSSIGGVGGKRKVRHRCSLAIALYQAYWGLGIGRAMIGYLTELARQIGYQQIELGVFADNARAAALYRKCGFTESGRVHRAYRLEDGSWHDEILMYREI